MMGVEDALSALATGARHELGRIDQIGEEQSHRAAVSHGGSTSSDTAMKLLLRDVEEKSPDCSSRNNSTYPCRYSAMAMQLCLRATSEAYFHGRHFAPPVRQVLRSQTSDLPLLDSKTYDIHGL